MPELIVEGRKTESDILGRAAQGTAALPPCVLVRTAPDPPRFKEQGR